MARKSTSRSSARKSASKSNYVKSSTSIAKLKKKGWTEARIAKAVGRDSSLISQISRGNKPGNNLRESLSKLASGKPVPVPSRRTTKSGSKARVRGEAMAGISVGHLGMKTFINDMRRVARRNGSVHMIIRWRVLKDRNGSDYRGSGLKSGETWLYGGIGRGSKADDIAYRAEQFAKFHPEMTSRQQLEAFLRSEVMEAHQGQMQGGYRQPHIEKADGLEGVRYDAFFHDEVKTTTIRRRRAA